MWENLGGAGGARRWRVGLAMAATIAAACSDPGVAPIAVSDAAFEGLATRGTSNAGVAPSSVGWQEQARALIGANNMSPLAAARVLAALGVAQYRAARTVSDFSQGPQVLASEVGRGKGRVAEARRGAVAGASVQVLSFLFPAAAGALEQRAQDEGKMESGELNPHFARGLAVGRDAGDVSVEHLRNDRITTPWTGTVPVGPGMWIANGPPAGATFGGVTPYLMTSGSQFRSPPPPAFNSSAFLTDLAEIKTLSVTRTAEQRDIALFWNFPTGTFTPPGYWNRTAADYIEAYGLNERAATRVFALTGAAMMDALIACWEAKYYYWTIRPNQADPSITLTFGLPNHPSYPSGHSCVSSAAATVLKKLFPDRSEELDAGVEEAGLSRMYAGIHYRFDITAGQALGQAVGRWTMRHAKQLD